MENTKWNFRKIHETRCNYIVKYNQNIEDKEYCDFLEHSIVSHYLMGNLTNHELDFINKYKLNSYIKKIPFDIEEISQKYSDSYKHSNDENYYKDAHFLLNTFSNKPNDLPMFEDCIFMPEDHIEITRKFYNELNNPIISYHANKILNYPNVINFTSSQNPRYKNFWGSTLYDIIDNKAYINCQSSNTSADLIVLPHEIIHAVDFEIKAKFYKQHVQGYQEVPTYFIDYLFLDFLKKENYNEIEIEKLKHHKQVYIINLAKSTLYEVNRKIKRTTEKDINNMSSDEINKVYDPYICKQVSELESCLVSSIMYKKYQHDPEETMSMLNQFLKNGIQKNGGSILEIFNLTYQDLIIEAENINQGSYTNIQEPIKQR
ncbi:MAG: hypothetical protein R3Y13_02225 [bacterium]